MRKKHKKKVKVSLKSKRKKKVSKITSNRGQVAVMSGVLLLLVGLVIIYLAFSFFTGTEASFQDRAKSGIETKLIELQSTFSLEKQYIYSIFIKNTGSVDIENGTVRVYLNDRAVDAFIVDVIHPGQTDKMNIYDWDVIGEDETEAELVVPGKLITRTMKVTKPNDL